MKPTITEAQKFLEHMAFDYGTSDMTVSDVKTCAEARLEELNKFLSYVSYLQSENEKMKSMIEHGLGWEDLRDDTTYDRQ